MLNWKLWIASVGVCVCGSGLAYAVSPNPLESAYWRMEEGTAGQIVPATVPPETGAVVDATGNGNHMRRFNDANAPTYTTEVPASIVPATGQADTLALRFSGSVMDVYTDGKDINNPIVDAFTLEASFNSDAVGVFAWQTVVSKESKSDDTTFDNPPLTLKITGDGSNKLRFEIRDKANQLITIDSQTTIEALHWYHAAVVATSTQVKLYLDSNDGQGYKLEGTGTVTGGGPLYQGTVPADGYDTVWNIGKGMWARQLADWFKGLIDEVRLTNQALAPGDFLWAQSFVAGDFDHDHDVDSFDVAAFANCYTGPDIPYAGHIPQLCTMTPNGQGKIAADFDLDGDVDQVDFGAIQVNVGITP